MVRINEAECKAAGVDQKEVARIARGLSKYGKQAAALGLCVFGGSGSGSLRKSDYPRRELVLAGLDGVFDGGDGACNDHEDGLMRGESA